MRSSNSESVALNKRTGVESLSEPMMEKSGKPRHGHAHGVTVFMNGSREASTPHQRGGGGGGGGSKFAYKVLGSWSSAPPLPL